MLLMRGIRVLFDVAVLDSGIIVCQAEIVPNFMRKVQCRACIPPVIASFIRNADGVWPVES